MASQSTPLLPQRHAAVELDSCSDTEGAYFKLHCRLEHIVERRMSSWARTNREHGRFVAPLRFPQNPLGYKALLTRDDTLSDTEKLKKEIAILAKLRQFCNPDDGGHRPVLAAMSADGRISAPAASWQSCRSVVRYDKTLKSIYFKNSVPFNRGAKKDLKIIGKTGPYAVYQVAHAGVRLRKWPTLCVALCHEDVKARVCSPETHERGETS
jgi:hypothetical protein